MDRKWVTFAVLLVLLLAGSILIALLGSVGGDDDDDDGTLKVEQAPTPEGGIEVLVTVPDDLNVLETTSGKALVDLVCTDDAGGTVIRARQMWPLARDGDPPLPHAHQPASPDELKSIARCKIVGTEPELSAELGLAR